MNKKACFISLGCKVNKYEIDCLANLFQQHGYEVFTHLTPADIYVVNTCAVTQEAEKKSRQYIAKINKLNPKSKILICGCASENNLKQFQDKPNVVSIIGNAEKGCIFEILENKTKKIFDIPKEYEELGNPLKTKTRAYLKIQDGCNNFCSYCLIPYVRGRSRSRVLKNVIAEAIEMAKDSKEIVLTGIDMSSYKVSENERNIYYAKTYANIKESADLSVLMEEMGKIPARVRLSSLEVGAITTNLLESCKRLTNFAPQFHLSLQSGSNQTLKNMNRKYTREQYWSKIKLIRKYFPEANITTDVIVGFPTETDKNFKETVDLAKRVKFGDIHIFPYSHRSGTVASKLPDLSSDIKKQRVHQLEKVRDVLKNKFLKKNLKKYFTVLIEDEENGYMVGYTENYIKVFLPKCKQTISGEMLKVKAIKIFQNGVLGEIV